MQLIFQNKRYFRVPDTLKGESGKTYEIQEQLKDGGNAIVCRALETKSGDDVAIKIQVNLFGKRPDRFRQEIEIGRAAKHQHLLPIDDAGEMAASETFRRADAQDLTLPFLVMPLADMDLRAYFQKCKRKIDYETYILQIIGLAEALAELHKVALHRDIKPENVLVKGETWLLSDYGLCKKTDPNAPDLSEMGENIGPRWWPTPEFINFHLGCGDEIRKSTDVFQLSSVFWFIINGRQPTGTITENDWSGPPELFPPLFRSLSHDHTLRPQDGAALASLLDNARPSQTHT